MPAAIASALTPVTAAMIERRIYLLRGLKVMLDSDPAALYLIETFNLNKGRETESLAVPRRLHVPTDR